MQIGDRLTLSYRNHGKCYTVERLTVEEKVPLRQIISVIGDETEVVSRELVLKEVVYSYQRNGIEVSREILKKRFFKPEHR